MLSLCTKSNFLKAGVAISLSYILFKLVNSYYKKPSPAQSSIDVSSFSNLNEVTTESYHLDLCIDFDSKKLTGTIILNMKSLINGLSLVCLDSKLLKIKNAFYKGQKIPFHVEKQLNGAALGDKLVFILPELIKALNSFTLTIDYETISDSSESSALNWLEPKQTLGKQLPYFYTQSEPIYSRTIAPMQDSPSVKSTYSARISVPKDFNVFMSAKKIQETEENFQKSFLFKQDIPIPSYLLAIISGDLEERALSDRTSVITEPEFLDLCAQDLEDLEKFLQTLENYLFEYGWGPYKVVVLPPSFPYGGMENPLLTFVSPSIITGDKSNIDVVIHEIAHSWSGNLVTCKNWSSFWLNEGITVFLERKAVKALYGERKFQLSALMEDMGLHETIKTIGVNHQYTSLTPDFNDFSNPDDAFSKVPYEKGFQLMMFLESLVGEEGIRGFLRNFLRKYSYKSCDSTDFIQTFSDFFKEKLGKNQFLNIEKKIQWDEWLKKPGFPPIKLAINISDFDDCKALALNFMNNGVSNAELIEKYEKFELDLKIVFLKSIYDGFNNVPKEKLEVLLDVLKLNNEKNKEILFVWLRVCVKNNFIENFVKVEEFLRSTGRMKFVVPLYVELGKVNMLFALEAFERNKKGYHSITSEIIGKKLKK